MSQKASIVDLFAGPGGLGEGFSAFRTKKGHSPFKIKVSVEMDADAHNTLTLRAFIRQFEKPPNEYYQYVRGKISREHLLELFPKEAHTASEETLQGPRTLGPMGNDDDLIYKRLRQLKRKESAPWVVIGGPPCQAYSLAGRSRNMGNSSYRAHKDSRYYLYKEYLKVLSTVRPAVFVMENVKGILSAKANDQLIFPEILEELRCPDKALGKSARARSSRYKIYSLVTGTEIEFISGIDNKITVQSEQYGIPQTRHRVILLGVREDVDRSPHRLKPHATIAKFGQCIQDLPPLRSGVTTVNGRKVDDTHKNWLLALSSNKRLIAKELHVLGLSTDELTIAMQKATNLSTRGGAFLKSRKRFSGPRHLTNWLPDPNLCGVLNHESKGHMSSDLGRYMFCSLYADQTSGKSPRSKDFPTSLAPNHKSWKSGKFADRFRVQSSTEPAKTITSHIAKDGHAFIHPEAAQCRSITVREAARIQTFPDNYFFEGGRTSQSVQVGNAVPPYLALQIAEIVNQLLN